MRYLSTALYAEGPRDVAFLRPLLQRLCMARASECAEIVEVSDVLVLDDRTEHRHLPREERIERAATLADGAWVILFIHADADADADGARKFRVEPGRRRIEANATSGRQCVPVIPVRETEAWALADADALRSAFGTTASDAALGLIEATAHGADRLPDPKQTLDAAFRAARPGRRMTSVAPYLARIAETAALDQLERLRAFQQLNTDLRDAMRELRILR